LVKWAGFLADPHPSILAPASVAQMCTPVVISDPERWTAGHGLGAQLWRSGERVYVGHAGSMPGYRAILMVHRATRTGVVAYANPYSPAGPTIDGLGLRLLDTVLDAEPGRVVPWRPGAAPPAEIEPLTGRWWWMGQEFEVVWDGGIRELLMYPAGEPAQPW